MDSRLKVVLDTTVLISAFLSPKGVAAQTLDRVATDCILVLSDDILAELSRKLLTKKKIRKAYQYEDGKVRVYLDYLSSLAGAFVHEVLPISGVVRDPEDDMIIACAATVVADLIITRDKDLLSLGAYGRTQIITPREFLDEIDNP